MTSWNPEEYLQFADERTRPASDLLNNIPLSSPSRVIDLGCGTGNSTALLAARWPAAHLDALDSSDAMLTEARQSGVSANWMLADLATWNPDATYDVIFSNAAFQWLPDQDKLLPRLMSFVSPKGTFAFQVPSNFNAPSHTILDDLAEETAWKGKLKSVRRIQQSSASGYYDIMKPHASSVTIWETEYLQVLAGEDAVYRWVSGTSLRPFINVLNSEEREQFIAAYKTKMNIAYPRRSDGTTLFPFQRIFVVAAKGS